MKKSILLWLSILAILAIPSVFADYGMMGYGMMGGGWFSWGLLWLVYLALATFVFSVIFWGTYKWLIKNKREEKKEKRK